MHLARNITAIAVSAVLRKKPLHTKYQDLVKPSTDVKLNPPAHVEFLTKDKQWQSLGTATSIKLNKEHQ